MCQLVAGTCEIITLDRDRTQPRRTIARQTARCACRKGQIAGTTRASPACVDGRPPVEDLYQGAGHLGNHDLVGMGFRLLYVISVCEKKHRESKVNLGCILYNGSYREEQAVVRDDAMFG
ncbi:hypothetical protein NFI96_000577 [Prochilodus magdalenae]|nr:hypothetical protein NFI96_000577 [Prochilodus magdalenae]